MKKDFENALFRLVSIGLGHDDGYVLELRGVDGSQLCRLSLRQGISSICLDGLQRLSQVAGKLDIDKGTKLQWIASTMKQEQGYNKQWQAAKALASLYDKEGVATYVMKGFSLSRLYPKPMHRQCTDMDCFLVDRSTKQCAYERGNMIAEQNGLQVDRSYYKHSKIYINGLTVENHQYFYQGEW